MLTKKLIVAIGAILILVPAVGFAAVKYDQKLITRLKGQILLQADSKGEAWYVNPKDGKRYYMKDGETAFAMLRKFGLGIKTSDLEKIPVGDIEVAGGASSETKTQSKTTNFVKTHSYSGTENINTEPFAVKNGAWIKFKYTFTPYDSSDNFIVRFTDPISNGFGDLLVNTIAESTIQGENNVYNKTSGGLYYFDVSGSGNWTIDVYELE